MKEIKQFTEPRSLQRLIFVCQTGGRNAKVKWQCSGIESFVFGAVLFNRLELTKKGKINVFDEETKRWLGYVKRGEYDIPTRYEAEEELYFDDFYTKAV